MRRLLLLLVAPLSLGLLLLGAFVMPRLGATQTLMAFGSGGSTEDGELRPGMSWTRDEAATGFARVLVARPDGPAPFPTLVFIHGVAVKGLDDARIIAGVAAFRTAGFLVIAPEVPVLVNPPDGDRDLERSAKLLHAVQAGAFPDVDAKRVGVIGVSVGGGLALRATCRFRAEGGTGPRALLALGAPDDLRRTMADWFALPYPEPGAAASFDEARKAEARFARNVVWRAALGRRVADLHDRRVLRRWLETYLVPVTSPLGLTSQQALEFVRLVAAGPGGWADTRDEVVRDAWPLMAVFSPAASGQELAALTGVACFLLHGTGDPLVPIEELDRLAGRLAKHTLVQALASRMLAHVGVQAVGLDEQAEHIVFLDDFFDIVRR